MLISKEYFNGDTLIPNMNEVNFDSGDIIDFINDETCFLLESILGFDLYSELQTYLDADGNLLPSAPDKWQDLVYGNVYERNNEERKFNGLLVRPTSSMPKSLLSDYVYYRWLKENISQSTGVGEVTLTAKNAVGVNATQKLVTVWNRFYRQIGVCYNYSRLPFYDGYYNNTRFTDWYGHSNYYVSLFEYLQHFKSDFPTAKLALPDDEFHGFQNQLGL